MKITPLLLLLGTASLVCCKEKATGGVTINQLQTRQLEEARARIAELEARLAVSEAKLSGALAKSKTGGPPPGTLLMQRIVREMIEASQAASQLQVSLRLQKEGSPQRSPSLEDSIQSARHCLENEKRTRTMYDALAAENLWSTEIKLEAGNQLENLHTACTTLEEKLREVP